MAYSQADAPLALVTAPWADSLLLDRLDGTEAVSTLFRFRLDFLCVASKPPVAFHDILGRPLTARFTQTAGDKKPPETRFFSGICVEFAEGAADETFRHYTATVAPAAWLMTRRARSRVFQQSTVPAILRKVIGETVADADYELTGTYEPRDYTVQYRETDFNFVCRLMEEEGMYYFFRHTASGHKWVIADSPKSHAALARPATYSTINTTALRPRLGCAFIQSWEKRQEIRSGKLTLRDHTFQLPHQSTEASRDTQESVAAGAVNHKLKLAVNAPLELYDWPGAYAQRFDGVAPGGGDRQADVQKTLTDNKRTAAIRMAQEASGAVTVSGTGEWAQMVPACRFAVATVPDDATAKLQGADGEYVVTRVTHAATMGGSYRSSPDAPSYRNAFSCQPAALPVVPPQLTPKPLVQGTQSAVVVGPPGEEIFTDKFGRVKVQFHWDREGKNNADSSCWLRVATPMAGRNWGAVHLPRVGQEVLVDFLEGDPDQPIVLGCLYNPDQMPAYKLPDHKTRSYLKTNSSPGGKGHNELRFEDKAGSEQVYVHAQRNLDVRVRNDALRKVGHDQHERVGFYIPVSDDGTPPPEKKHGSLFEEVAVDHHYKVHKNLVEHVGGDAQLLVGGVDGPGNYDVRVKKDFVTLVDGNRDFTVKQKLTETVGDYDLGVKKAHKHKVGMDYSLTAGMNHQSKAGLKYAVEAGMEVHIKAGASVVIEAGATLTLKVGGSFVSITPANVAIQAPLVLINSGGAAGAGGGCSPQEPADAKAPKDAAPTKPKEADSSVTGKKSN